MGRAEDTMKTNEWGTVKAQAVLRDRIAAAILAGIDQADPW